jgi:hypothetical protein
MGIERQQSEFPRQGFPTVGENNLDNSLRSTERPAVEEIKIRRKAVRQLLGEKLPEISHRRNVEHTLYDALIKVRQRIPELRVETPQYLSESDAVDGSHPTASRC